MFKRDSHITLGDVAIEWFDLRTGALFHDPPESFTRKYGTPSQPEHPFELYAVQFSKEGISSEFALLNRVYSLISKE
jgi:CRISPR/Cas system-associated protein Cas10 (large subunit of type III CRISPR-Cas system)